MPFNSLVSRTDVAALVPEEVSNAMLTSLEAQSTVLGMGQRIPVSRKQQRFPVLSALPTAYFVNGDTGLKQTTEAAWDNKYMTIEEIATIVPIPEAVLDDSDFDVWGSIQPLMEAAIARKLDAAVFFDADAPSTWPDGLVSGAVAAGNVVARGTNDPGTGGVHGDLSDLLATLEADGYVPNGAVGNITLKARLRQVRDTTGQTLALPADLPTPAYGMEGMWPTGGDAAEMVAGDFTKLVVGVRQDMTYKLITEGVITNDAGEIQYNLPQQDMVALRLVFRAGYQIANPVNFQNVDEGTRYPFAVLRSPTVTP